MVSALGALAEVEEGKREEGELDEEVRCGPARSVRPGNLPSTEGVSPVTSLSTLMSCVPKTLSPLIAFVLKSLLPPRPPLQVMAHFHIPKRQP